MAVLLGKGLALCPKRAMGVHSSVKYMLSFFSLAKNQNVHHKFIPHRQTVDKHFWADILHHQHLWAHQLMHRKHCSGQTFYHMQRRMCGENHVRGDTVETGFFAMTVLLTTLLRTCRNFWLIMT